jgi:hypothetical protein
MGIALVSSLKQQDITVTGWTARARIRMRGYRSIRSPAAAGIKITDSDLLVS